MEHNFQNKKKLQNNFLKLEKQIKKKKIFSFF